MKKHENKEGKNSKQVDINNLLSEIIQTIKQNSLATNISFWAEPSRVNDFENSIQRRTISLFEKLSFDEQVLFISNLEQEFYSFEDPQVLSFLLADLFFILQKNKKFEERKESLLANNAFIDSLVTCSAVILLYQENDALCYFDTKSIDEQLFRFLFIDNKEKIQVLLFDKLKSILTKGFDRIYLDNNFFLYQLLLSDTIVVGFEDNFINFLKNNLKFISIYDDERYLYGDEESINCANSDYGVKNDWLLGCGSIQKPTHIILNKIRTDSEISYASMAEWEDEDGFDDEDECDNE